MLWTILVVLLILALVGSPSAGFAPAAWGWGPSGMLGVVVIILLILILMGRA